MRNFGLLPQGVDLTPCKYCGNPIAELHETQCLHDMGSEYAPCKQLARIALKKRGRQLEIMWVCLCTALAIGVLFALHHYNR